MSRHDLLQITADKTLKQVLDAQTLSKIWAGSAELSENRIVIAGFETPMDGVSGIRSISILDIIGVMYESTKEQSTSA
jgi:hypothetical protein